MKYEKMVREIVEAIGGKENILNVYHCATRLRFQLKQEDTIQDETVKNIEGVLSVVKGGGQYQIVIGRHVGDVYQELLSVYDMQKEESGLKDAKEFKEEMKDKKISSRFIDTISGVFTPILNLLIATGIIKCFLALMTATGLMDATAGTYQILSIAGDCFFYFMPVFLGYTAMKKFGGTPFVGMAIGAALVYPSIAVIMGGEPLYTLFAGTIFESPVYVTFLGIPVILMNYASSVIPVVLVCFFAAKLERFLDRCIPQLVKAFVVPMLTILGGVVLGLLVLGPIATFASNLLGALMGFLFEINSTICGFLYGALIQVCVMFVVLMIMLKTKNKKLKGVCGPAIISAMFGITEPAIYGVTLQFKRPFILACLASGIGGAIIGFGGVKQYSAGTNGIFGWLQVINPQTGFDSTVVAAIIACIASFVSAVVLMKIFDKKLGIDHI